jgi:mRNA interferase YafQ
MLKPEFTGQFKKDYELAVKRGCDPDKLEEAITLLCI